jgi:hypothetical protein
VVYAISFQHTERRRNRMTIMASINEQKLLTEKHVRPKVQRKSLDTNKNKNKNDNNDNKNNDDVEETRKRMESWMGVGGKKSNNNNSGAVVSSKKSSNNNGTIVSTNQATTTIISSDIADDAGGAPSQEQQEQKPPVSILRSPKYSTATIVSQTNDHDDQQKNQQKQQQRTTGQTIVSTNIVESNNNNITKKISSTPRNVICRDFVVERDPTKATKKIKPFRNHNSKSDVNGNDNINSLSIEGYVPTTGINAAAAAASIGVKFKNDVKNEEGTNDNYNNTDAVVDDPLVISSLEGLMRAAGENLPDNKITDDTKMVEADISFSVMTKDQYESKLPTIQQEHEEERQQQLEVFMGRHDIFDDEENNESIEGGVDGVDGNDNDDDDNDDDDALMELFMGADVEINNDDDNEERDNLMPEIRAFTLLWNALTDWMTHETVVWVKGLRDSHNNNIKKNAHDDNDDHRNNTTSTIMSMDNEWTPMFDLSDIGASRCAGVLAMIRLYLGRCMDELNQKTEDRRRAEKRLNDIMRTFDYTQENPKLTSSYWKAMACILLDMVLIETRAYPIVDIPFSVKAVGMTLVEFEYLSRKAVLTFDPTP